MSMPKSAFLLPAGIAAAALALFLWPVPTPPPLPPVEASAAPRLHFQTHDEPVALPRGEYAPSPLLRARPEKAMAAVRDLGAPAKEVPASPALSDGENAQIQTERTRLVDQFKELETTTATVTFDGDNKTGHLRFVRINEPSPEHLSALYDAGTAAVAKFADGSPGYEAMRQEVAKLVDDYSQPRMLNFQTKPSDEWSLLVITGNPETTGVPDAEGNIHFEGGAMKTVILNGTGELTADPKTERYWHLFKR
jgi:hypothetical protein